MYQAIDDDTITVGALGVRFLVESDDSNGNASVFECYVPANARHVSCANARLRRNGCSPWLSP